MLGNSSYFAFIFFFYPNIHHQTVAAAGLHPKLIFVIILRQAANSASCLPSVGSKLGSSKGDAQTDGHPSVRFQFHQRPPYACLNCCVCSVLPAPHSALAAGSPHNLAPIGGAALEPWLPVGAKCFDTVFSFRARFGQFSVKSSAIIGECYGNNT